MVLVSAGSDTARTQQTVINQKRTNKNGRRGENVIIFIIARQGGKLGAFREFFPSFSFFNAASGYDISAHEYGMYRDTCLLPYESEIATP